MLSGHATLTGWSAAQKLTRRLVYAVVVVGLVGPAAADPARIGIYEDPEGTDCSLSAPIGAVTDYYIVVTPPPGGGVRGVEFGAPFPDCLNGMIVSQSALCDCMVFGEPSSGVDIIATSGCWTEPTAIWSISVLSNGAEPCCEFPVTRHPDMAAQPEFVDCNSDVFTAEGLLAVVNSNASCPCDTPERGEIRIELATEPSGRTGFRFTHDINTSGVFILDDGGARIFGDIPAGIYTVSEYDPLVLPGSITLRDIVCHDSDSSGLESIVDVASGTATIYLDGYETVTCTFINGADCNNNGVDDAIDLAGTFTNVSPLTHFTSPNGSITHTIASPPAAIGSSVSFDIVAIGAPPGQVDVSVNGTPMGSGSFGSAGCTFQSEHVTAPVGIFNTALAGGDAEITIEFNGSETCSSSLMKVTTSYGVAQSLDCNSNSTPDECDIANGSVDCQPDGVPDECQIADHDCNSTGVPDDCEVAAGSASDCQGNLVPDECDIGGGTSTDCLPNGVPDECEPDCNNNGHGDDCDIFHGTSVDCNSNGRPDECDIALAPGEIALLILGADDSANFPVTDLALSASFTVVDGIDIRNTSPDLGTLFGYDAVLLYTNNSPAAPALLGDRLADYVDSGGRLAIATYAYSDPLAIAGRVTTPGYAPLVNSGVKGSVGPALIPIVPDDLIFNGINVGGVSYFKNSFFAHADLDAGATLLAKDASDVNMIARNAARNVYGLNLYPAKHASNNAEFYRLLARILTFPGSGSSDCQGDSIPDECQVLESDCNLNAIPDDCDIAAATSADCLPDGIPDECQPDCNTNGEGDDCDIAFGLSLDCQPDGVPDECQLGAGRDCNRTGIPDDCESFGPGDFDGDYDVDLVDFAFLAEAMTGPSANIIDEFPDCWFIYFFVFDSNLDLHLDLRDFAEFQRLFVGS